MIISSMETNQHWSVHVAPVHGALEEAEVMASEKLFCIDILVLLESASIHF